MLTVDRLNVRYGDLQILWDVSLKVDDGEVVALIGSNGAGKSTLIRTIAGLNRAASGEVRFNGVPIHDKPAHEVVASGISMVPEGRRLFPRMTVRENLEIGAFPKEARRQRRERLDAVYEIFPVLKDRSGQQAGLLSGGEQQMAAIGRALMGAPRLLLLDEMSLGLSPLAVKTIFKVVRRINASGIGVFIVEQNVPMTLKVADRAYILESGRIVGEGVASDLLGDDHVRRAYLGICAG